MSGDSREPGSECWLSALSALNRREHSRLELARKLQAKGYSEEEVESALDRLVEKGWLDDARYAGALARTRASSGQGPRRIQHTLARQGVTDEASEAALASCEVDWKRQARALVVRRFGAADLRRGPLQQKALAFLLRRGFDLDVARAALSDGEE
jgi:regulatory protein